LKIPPGLFFKGGDAYAPVLLVIAIGALIPPQAFLSSPFDKGGQGDFITRAIGTNFWHSLFHLPKRKYKTMELLNPKIKVLPGNHIKIMIDEPNLDFAKAKDWAELKAKEI
jgi:hypothetical protein